jgi:hypothetical protein
MTFIVIFLFFLLGSGKSYSQSFSLVSSDEYLQIPIADFLNKTVVSRRKQILVIKQKRLDLEAKPTEVLSYLNATAPCLMWEEKCLEKAETKPFLGSFYKYLSEDDIKAVSSSLERNRKQIENNIIRTKILENAFRALSREIQEIDGPNDDSINGENEIYQFFRAAGIENPIKELGSNKTDNWAWCSAFITSLLNESGLGVSFLKIDEYLDACKNMEKEEHCHPVQVDFILEWAKMKGLSLSLKDENSYEELQPGDLLVLINPKTRRASHIGIYLAKKCYQENCWIYSIEGNAGPLINDAVENDWKEVKSIIKKNNISSFNFERILDRVTLVKRPIQVWDYGITID